jgi:ribonuclease HI
MNMLIFSDASADPQLKTGFGAYLVITDADMNTILTENTLKEKLKVKQFSSTSSTQLEIETILCALQDLTLQQPASALINKVTVYTDSQGVIELPKRRTALELSDFAGRGNKRLKQDRLYQTFYRMQDNIRFELKKLRGHTNVTEKRSWMKYFHT